MAGVVRLEHLGRARQVEIVQARHPEAVRTGAQHVAPVATFLGRERPDGLVRAQQRIGARDVEYAGREVDAPVVDGHRDVEQPLVAAREVEVEEAAEAYVVTGAGRRVREQHVVAEQVAMAWPGRQRRIVVRREEAGLVRELAFEQRALRVRDERHDGRYVLLPPRQAAQVRLAARIVAAREVQAREHLSDLDAVFDPRREFGRAVELRDDRGRLAVQFAEQRAVVTRDRIRDRHAVGGQMAHQVEVERQLLRRQLFEDREDVFAARRRQEEIAVFDTGRNAAERKHVAQFVVAHPLREIGVGNSGENGHAGCVRSGCRHAGGVHRDSR